MAGSAPQGQGLSLLGRVGGGRTHACEQIERGHSRFMNFLEMAATRIAGRGVSEQDLGEPADDGQLILEVVAARVVVSHSVRSTHLREVCRTHDRSADSEYLGLPNV